LRLTALRLVTWAAAALWLITELLGSVHRLSRMPVAIAWILAAVCGATLLARRPRFPVVVKRPDVVVALCAAATTLVAAVTGITAWLSPPNSADAMAYHLPRVVYWAEQSGIGFFPTPYLNQIMLQPFAEYVMLHLYLLSGGDALTNLVQWSASVVSMVAVSLAAAYFGSSPRGQALAALFCASLPAGILASSGAKNDYVLAAWMVIAVCFALRFAAHNAWKDALYLGAAIGFALLTKATAYLFLPWLVAAILLARWRPVRWPGGAARAAAMLACALAINAPHYLRNYGLSGSVLGFDSAHADGQFRWRNETFGWKQTVSNLMRNGAEQLGGRSEQWNRGVYRAVIAADRLLGIDPQDPDTTWRWAAFAPPKNANHEANAPNQWHLAILAAVACLLLWRAARGRSRERALYAAALLCGLVAFCAYLKWQPFLARLFLPLFVAAAPLAAIIEDLRPRRVALAVQLALCFWLLSGARLPLLQNWVRPLKGPAGIFHVPREQRYFADMSQWDNRESYLQSAAFLAGQDCGTVGIDINRLELEYPLMALLRARRPSVRFVHTAVANPSRKYPQPVAGAPCAIACLDCAGDPVRLGAYPDFPQITLFGRFAILRKRCETCL
jgi:hypothetical protein